MGDITQTLFGRSELPENAIIYAGGYYESRSKKFLEIFDDAEPIQGKWTPYTYAKSGESEFFVIYNVYGAATTLEVMRILEDGGVKRVIFIGLVFSKTLDIGQQVISSKVIDRAGVVLIDTDGEDVINVNKEELELLIKAYNDMDIKVINKTIVSVPCVFHNIESVSMMIKDRDDVDGVEMELSTFYHFGMKAGFETYGLLVVSDNPTHSLLDNSKDLKELRVQGRNDAGKVGIHLIRHIL